MPHVALRRLRTVLDLRQKLRLDSDALVGDPFGVELCLADQRLQSSLQVVCRGGIEAVIHLSGIEQALTFLPPDKDAVERSA